ncbi:hypothetical protein DVK44_19115 [Streptomyces paludis]|uniref:DUF2599 domain-containing protein n=2 Tax=Streptomyces paludis TaxID=2282738 RepID=A0A345HRT7_9ACTN|nr:hypothetical protein DVK44_19115 [Streptomyces paludis]
MAWPAWSAAALAMLALAGFATKEHWQHQWFAATLCEGSLRASDLADVLPDQRLQAGTDETDADRGRMKCRINRDERHYALAVDAYTDPEDLERQLDYGFSIPLVASFALPAGIPGLANEFGPVILQDCPDLGRDAQGRQRRLLTTVHAWGEETTPASARIAVSMANTASERLGCGAAPLPTPPAGNAPYEPPPAVPPAKAKGTVCGWLAGLTLPKSPNGAEWGVVPHTDADAPVTGCSLRDPASGKTAVSFSGWYGDWTEKPFERLLMNNVAYADDLDSGQPMMSEELGRARARCDDETVNYLAFDYPRGTDIRDRHLTGRQLRPLLNAFAKDQAKRRGCTDLELPPAEIHPKKKR